MRKNTSILENQITKTMPVPTKAWIHSQTDSMKSISDCTTVVSEVDFMEETEQTLPPHQLESSFRKQMNTSFLQGSSCNPNIKKSRILVVESRIIQEGEDESHKGINRQMEELESIERKTQSLVAKEREQRRELKKLKKMYVQKLDELVKQEETHLMNANQLNHTIHTLLSDKIQLSKEKQMIQQNMLALQQEAEKTRQEIKSIQMEKEELTHKIQIFESHFKERSIEQHPVETENVLDLDRQITIIDKTIILNKKKGCEKDINRLLELKIELLQKRQCAKVKQQAKKYTKMITNLNELLSSRNNLLKSKNRTIIQLEKSIKKHQQKEKEVETAQSFYAKANDQCEQNLDEDVQQWDQFKKSVRSLINCNRIAGHEQSYETIEQIVLGMIHLFQNETCCEEDVLELVEISLDHLNTKYASKAKLQVSKIQRLLKNITPQQGMTKTPHQKMQQKVNNHSQLR